MLQEEYFWSAQSGTSKQVSSPQSEGNKAMLQLQVNSDLMIEHHDGSLDLPKQIMKNLGHWFAWHHPNMSCLHWLKITTLKTKNCNSYHPQYSQTKVGMNRCNTSQKNLTSEWVIVAPSILCQISRVLVWRLGNSKDHPLESQLPWLHLVGNDP